MLIRSYPRSYSNGYLASIFVDTGANINTATRDFYNKLVTQGLQEVLKQGLKLKW